MLVFHAIAPIFSSAHDTGLQRHSVEIILRYFHKATDASRPSPALALSAPVTKTFKAAVASNLAGLQVPVRHVKVAEIEVGQSGILHKAHSFLAKRHGHQPGCSQLTMPYLHE